MSNAQVSGVSASKTARHLPYQVCQFGVLSHLRLWGARKAASAVSHRHHVRGGPMRSAVEIMRHSVAIGAMAVAVALVGGAPPAYGAPCDGGCNINPGNIAPAPRAIPRSPAVGPSNRLPGSRGVQPAESPPISVVSGGVEPTNPDMKLAPDPIVSNRPVIQRDPPRVPVNIPPPDLKVPQPISPRIPFEPPPPDVVPVDTPPPDVVPVDVVPSAVPVAPVPVAPIPVENPLLPAPPSAPPVPVSTPVSGVLFTSSAEPGTQALTLIVLFMACGCWIYGNRIGSQMTVRKTDRAAAGA